MNRTDKIPDLFGCGIIITFGVVVGLFGIFSLDIDQPFGATSSATTPNRHTPDWKREEGVVEQVSLTPSSTWDSENKTVVIKSATNRWVFTKSKEADELWARLSVGQKVTIRFYRTEIDDWYYEVER